MSGTTDPGAALTAVPNLSARPRCECEHPAGDCTADADYRVSVGCAAEGCDGAVHMHLICAECLEAWLANAAEDGVELRVRPL